MAVRAEFIQGGPAYLWGNGRLMADGLPRFEPGKFAGTRALRIEEGTTNILTANQSNVETDGTGFTTIGGATAARTTAESFEGVASYKVTFDATAASGTQVIVSTSTQSTYVGRLRVKGDATSYPANSLGCYLRINYSDGTLDEAINTISPDATWQDIVISPVASNTGKTVSSVTLMVRQVGTTLNGRDIWIDALQIERQTEATTWHVGGGTRAGARCLVPAARLFDAVAGTVEAWVKIPATVEHHLIFDTRQVGDALSNTRRCLLWINNAGGGLMFLYWNGAALRTLAGGAVTAGAWTHVACAWGLNGGKVYRDGALIASHADVPQLVSPSRLALGGQADGGDIASGLLLGGMRFTRGRARTDAEILAAYNSNAQFVEDGADSTVFTFDGTMRSLLPPLRYQVAPESTFLRPTTVTASTSATDYPASNSADYEFPLRSHRTTTVAQSTLTFDFGAVVNFRALFIALTNWEWCQVATSYDGVTYTNVAQSPLACVLDPADQYRKVGAVLSVSGRYARITIVAQAADGNASYFETPLVIFSGDVDAFNANPNWGAQMAIEHEYESNSAGGHDEVQARGQRYLTMQVRGEPKRGYDNEWMQLAGQGNHRKFLLFVNMGKAEESYLMRADGSAQWEERVGVTAFSLKWREHIN